jgi:hypothetical protein
VEVRVARLQFRLFGGGKQDIEPREATTTRFICVLAQGGDRAADCCSCPKVDQTQRAKPKSHVVGPGWTKQKRWDRDRHANRATRVEFCIVLCQIALHCAIPQTLLFQQSNVTMSFQRHNALLSGAGIIIKAESINKSRIMMEFQLQLRPQ